MIRALLPSVRVMPLRRGLTTTLAIWSGKPSFSRPAPPPLPAQEQREFEKLVKEKQNISAFLSNAEEELHPDARRKPRPEFDGEVNPKTGEIGGPKNDPLSYEKEWTYGGRATDF